MKIFFFKKKTHRENKATIKYLDHDFDYKLDNDPINSLKELVKISKFKNNEIDVPFPTLVGYLGYPMIQFMENIKLKNTDNIKIPDATLIRPKIVAVFDNIKDILSIMCVSYPSKKVSPENAYKNSNLLL